MTTPTGPMRQTFHPEGRTDQPRQHVRVYREDQPIDYDFYVEAVAWTVQFWPV